jgi:hypothetical protein
MSSTEVKVRYVRKLRSWLCILIVATLSISACAEESGPADFVVYKNPQCGCCDKWVSHVQNAGYSVKVRQSSDMSDIKKQYGIDDPMQSCHTAVHEGTGLVFEGHIPVTHLTSLIETPVEGAIGLSVPGMPVGSPGMEMGGRKDPYQVHLLKENGQSITYAIENGSN